MGPLLCPPYQHETNIKWISMLNEMTTVMEVQSLLVGCPARQRTIWSPSCESTKMRPRIDWMVWEFVKKKSILKKRSFSGPHTIHSTTELGGCGLKLFVRKVMTIYNSCSVSSFPHFHQRSILWRLFSGTHTTENGNNSHDEGLGGE